MTAMHACRRDMPADVRMHTRERLCMHTQTHELYFFSWQKNKMLQWKGKLWKNDWISWAEIKWGKKQTSKQSKQTTKQTNKHTMI